MFDRLLRLIALVPASPKPEAGRLDRLEELKEPLKAVTPRQPVPVDATCIPSSGPRRTGGDARHGRTECSQPFGGQRYPSIRQCGWSCPL